MAKTFKETAIETTHQLVVSTFFGLIFFGGYILGEKLLAAHNRKKTRERVGNFDVA